MHVFGILLIDAYMMKLPYFKYYLSHYKTLGKYYNSIANTGKSNFKETRSAKSNCKIFQNVYNRMTDRRIEKEKEY